MSKRQSTLTSLIQAYFEEGYEVSVGVNPYRENGPYSSFATFYDINNRHPVTGAGIAIDEIYFFETLLSRLRPKNIYTIGVAMGWSLIAMGLICPDAVLWGIDNCTEGSQADSRTGVELAKSIGQKLGLDMHITIGTSPYDIPISIPNNDTKVDLAFIDGLHTNAQIIKDFSVVHLYMNYSAVIVFHDVLNFKMYEGWQHICYQAAKYGFNNTLLRRTASGMGVLYRNISVELERDILSFYQHPKLFWPGALPADYETIKLLM